MIAILTTPKRKDMIVVTTGDNISFYMEVMWENKISKENNKLQKLIWSSACAKS